MYYILYLNTVLTSKVVKLVSQGLTYTLMAVVSELMVDTVHIANQ